MASIVRFIESRLRLKVNAAKSAVAKPEERHFVGFTLRRRKRIEVKLSRRSRDRIDTKLRTLTPRTWGWSLGTCIKHMNQYLQGWTNFFGYSCTEEVIDNLRVLDAHIRRRLRALLLRQWRRRRSIARRLARLGVTARTAWRTVYQGRKRLWALSHTNAVEQALGLAYFQKRGLDSLEQLDRALRRILIAPAQLTLSLGQLRAAMPATGVRD
jgi:hypothetical protein